jgi:hypothetical protein
MTYEEQLKDPRWLEFREKVYTHDNRTCILCKHSDRPIHAHHCRYRKGRQAWEYELWEVVTLCDHCHEIHHKMKEPARNLLLEAVKLMDLDHEQIGHLIQVAAADVTDAHSRYKTACTARARAIVSAPQARHE